MATNFTGLSKTLVQNPWTVAFGDHDWILPKRSRCRNELPAHTTWIDKRGWGHVPMWADPAGVSQLISEGCGLCAHVKERR